jgi:hypothetical protein
MVISSRQHIEKEAAQQGAEVVISEANKIGACTPYDFHSKNLTAYGGLLPVATMLEKLEFQQVVEETLKVKRATRCMTMYQFVLAMVLALYVGFSRLNHLRFLAREPMLVGILQVLRLPPQCTFWRFLASLHFRIPTFWPGVPSGGRCLRLAIAAAFSVAPSRKPKTVFLPSWATPIAAIIWRLLNGVPSITMAHNLSSPSGRSISVLNFSRLAWMNRSLMADFSRP